MVAPFNFLIATMILPSVQAIVGLEGELPPQATYRWDDGETYTALSDFGKLCSSNSECQSGICGTSCSSFDANPFTSTSCICPCTDEISANDTDGIGTSYLGPCCCGCLINGGPTVNETDSNSTTTTTTFTSASTCPNYVEGWARAEGASDPSLESIPCNFTYTRFSLSGIADDDVVIPPGVEYQVDYTGPSTTGTKQWGEPCDTADECQSGMCGTGCDCPDDVLETCSCNAPCNFPAKCCAGCNNDTDPLIRSCPVVDYDALGASNGFDYNVIVTDAQNRSWYENRIKYTTFDGPSPWQPGSGDEGLLTPHLCSIYKFTMAGAIVPTACNEILEKASYTQFDQTLAEALCRFTSNAPTTPEPTIAPTPIPTTQKPTASPTVSPTAIPTVSPTILPTGMPTVSPTLSPTSTTPNPTVIPTQSPTTATPSIVPTTMTPLTCESPELQCTRFLFFTGGTFQFRENRRGQCEQICSLFPSVRAIQGYVCGTCE